MSKPLIGIAPNYKINQKRGDAYYLYADYARLISEGGALPVILPVVATLEGAREIMSRLDGLLLTGGLDLEPSRYGQAARYPKEIGPSPRNASDLYLARAAQERGTPALGICLGIQVMNVEFGGSLLQHIPEDLPGGLRHEERDVEGDPPPHRVTITPGTLLARILGTDALEVNSFHHQAVDRVAPGFRPAAKSEDGVTEAIERIDHTFYLGVQWHPERMLDAPSSRRLVGAFVGAARGASIRA